MGQPQPETTPASDLPPALLEEKFDVVTLNVITQDHELPTDSAPGRDPQVGLRFLIGEAGPGVFLYAKVAWMPPELAVACGEYLVKEATRLRSGLVLAGPSAAHQI